MPEAPSLRASGGRPPACSLRRARGRPRGEAAPARQSGRAGGAQPAAGSASGQGAVDLTLRRGRRELTPAGPRLGSETVSGSAEKSQEQNCEASLQTNDSCRGAGGPCRVQGLVWFPP